MRASSGIRDVMLEAMNSFMGSGCFVECRTGTRPAGGPTATATGTKLFESALPNPPLAADATNGVIAFSAIPDATALADGAPGYLRVRNSGGGIFDYDATELTMPATIVTGMNVKVPSLSITFPVGP